MTYTVTNPVHGYSGESATLHSACVAASMIWDGAGIVAIITDANGNVVETMTDSTSIIPRY